MSIKDATPEEIAAMRERINKRQSDRRYEMEMDEAVAMACRANRSPFPAANQGPCMESIIVATGMMATAGAAAILGSTGAVPMGYAVAVAGVAMAGAVTQVAREVQK